MPMMPHTDTPADTDSGTMSGAAPNTISGAAVDQTEAALRLHLARARTAQSRLATRAAERQADLAALAGQLRAADARQAALAAEVAALRCDLTALKRSTSWRITAPLRMLVRGLRRVRAVVTG